jgi:hypothetical protein
MKFTDSKHCSSRRHCTACRSSRSFRLSLAEVFELPENEIDFDCPHGEGPVRAEEAAPIKPKSCGCGQRKTRRGLGDIVAGVTTAMGLKTCARCKRRQIWLNRIGCRLNRCLHRVVNWLIPCSAPETLTSRSETES